MSAANEMSLIAGRACGARVVWGLRSADVNAVSRSLVKRSLFRTGALLSPLADRIIINSQRGRDFHVSQGYCDRRITVIPNGIDTRRFSISPEGRRTVRREWGVADEEILIGRVARLDRRKDYPTFFKTATIILRALPNAKFVCVGDGTDCDQLRELARTEDIATRMIWAGGRADMPAVYNAMDICVSSSLCEGFPNAVAEPMATGTPCVATKVGDCALLVGDTGLVVPPADPRALAAGVLRMIDDRGQFSRLRVRRRIVEQFSAQRLVDRTQAEFESLLAS